nr:PREDICTED: organic cation transporter protein isoform X1 [Bemisia tabaci]XP_018902799.1 PREDICTED: organic cation transporter protein isoform X1 [Bemisia tabaci]XP_018902800.1 PREDICTED: organic cation transporter protein isoform X2 [Bemisia tabaci]
MGADQDLEDLMSHIGDFGKYQLRQYLLLSLAAVCAGLHMLTSVTVSAVPKHRCAIPEVEVNGTVLDWNSTEVRSWMVPDKDGTGYSQCLLHDEYKNVTFKCDAWIYDHTYYKSSRAIEWNMVCDRRWMGAISQMLYMLGVFSGAVVLGSLADTYGRKKIFYISAIGQLAAGVSVAFVKNYVTFVTLTYIYGIFGSAGAFITGYVLAMEIIGASKRTFYGIGMQIFFASGICLVAFWGWLIKDRVWLQLVYGLHSVLLIGHWWLIDESPRWLWANGRREEAVEIVERAMRVNDPGASMDTGRFLKGLKGKEKNEKEREANGDHEDLHEPRPNLGILDLFKTPQLRMRSLIVCLNWFAASLGYYGLSLGASRMEGNPYATLFFMAFIEAPCYFIVMAYMDRTGRRSMNSTFLLVGAVSLLAATLIPKTSPAMQHLVTYVIYIGKFCVSGSFAIIYNYSAELFPTVLRNTGIGVGSMCARFAAATTPLISLLDSFDERIPMFLFSIIVLVSGVLSMLLPETVNQPMPNSVEDGENFRVGDTCCTTGCFPIGPQARPRPRGLSRHRRGSNDSVSSIQLTETHSLQHKEKT